MIASPASTTDASIETSDRVPPSGFVGDPRRPGAYERILTGAFFIAPIAALAALVLANDGVPWFAIGLTAVFIVVVGHGVTIGYHRLFAHRSFEANRPLKISVALLGTCAFQGSVIGWVADHRRHHRYADRPGDPHSPLWKDDTPLFGIKGLWHAHLGWCFTNDRTSRGALRGGSPRRPRSGVDRSPVRAAVRSRRSRSRSRSATCGADGPARVTALLCAGFVRVGLMLNGTWSVNSICHRFGKRPFATKRRQHELRAARDRDDGRVLAQQPPRVSSFGAPRARPPAGRHFGAHHQVVREPRLGDQRQLAEPGADCRTTS